MADPPAPTNHEKVAVSPWKEHLNGSMALAVVLTAVSGLLLGYDLCVITVALDLVADAFSLGTLRKELIVSLVMAGATVGALCGGPITDQFGRKRAVLGCGVLFVIGSIVMAIANDYAVLLVGRLIVGLAIGGSGMAVSVYITEIAHPKLRGSLVAINEVMICLGCLLAIGLDSLLTRFDHGWRYMLGASAVPAFLQIVGLVFLPESPRWLILQGNLSTAKQNLFRLRKRRGDVYSELFPVRDETVGTPKDDIGEAESGSIFIEVDSTWGDPSTSSNGKDSVHNDTEELRAKDSVASDKGLVDDNVGRNPILIEFEELKNDIEELRNAWLQACRQTLKTKSKEEAGTLHLTHETAHPSLWQQFRKSWKLKAHRAALLTAGLVAICQNLTFANAMLYYSHEIFLRAKLENDLLSSLGVGVAKFVGVAFALFLIPKVNRRILLLGGTLGQFASVLIMVVGFSSSISTELRGPLVVSGMILFIFAWDVSWAPLMWVCASELLPMEIRGLGMGVAVSLFWLSSVVTNQTMLSLMDTLGNSGGLLVVAGSTVAGFALVFIFLPETRNKSLEDIQLLFRRKYGDKGKTTKLESKNTARGSPNLAETDPDTVFNGSYGSTASVGYTPTTSSFPGEPS
eukprot:gb/GECG01003652.1/.p1 GENE.gb/GECG01003652.1/~~gb/GECG01003652.1/.p1  ORF type:complete len:630 (+),score=59.54 gb/GECG01003652.1/:1-1890(+)